MKVKVTVEFSRFMVGVQPEETHTEAPVVCSANLKRTVKRAGERAQGAV